MVLAIIATANRKLVMVLVIKTMACIDDCYEFVWISEILGVYVVINVKEYIIRLCGEEFKRICYEFMWLYVRRNML